MKIWISRDKDDGGGCVVHVAKPTRDEYGAYDSDKDHYEMCSLGQKVFKKLLSLDDWPRVGEVMEYDTDTEQGIIEAYLIPEKKGEIRSRHYDPLNYSPWWY